MLKTLILLSIFCSFYLNFSCSSHHSIANAKLEKKSRIRSIDSQDLLTKKNYNSKKLLPSLQDNVPQQLVNAHVKPSNFPDFDPIVAKKMVDDLKKIKNDISSPDTMEAIGKSLKLSSWDYNFYTPTMYYLGSNNFWQTNADELQEDKNLRNRLGANKEYHTLMMNDFAPEVFGFRDGSKSATKDESTMSAELYTIQDPTNGKVSLFGNIQIEILRDTQENIHLDFGTYEIKNGEKIYSIADEVVLDEKNKPVSGILTVKFIGPNASGRSETIQKEYNLSNLTDSDKNNIKKLGIFNI